MKIRIFINNDLTNPILNFKAKTRKIGLRKFYKRAHFIGINDVKSFHVGYVTKNNKIKIYHEGFNQAFYSSEQIETKFLQGMQCFKEPNETYH